MSKVVHEVEGAWEDIGARGAEFAGKQVRRQVLATSDEDCAGDLPHSTAGSLLQYAQGGVGDDFEECLEMVSRARLKPCRHAPAGLLPLPKT